jgi:3-methyladenine DNA glycosylase AlkD
VVASLRRMGSARVRDGMARYGLPAENAFGVSVAAIQALAKRLGRSHELARELWDAEWFEARMLSAFVDEPERITAAQMDRWARAFDNWGICDTVCFHLFDRTPHAFRKVAAWARSKKEFERRAAFALLASLAGHDRTTPDGAFERCLPLVERYAGDERNFVKKGVSWALRRVGRRSPSLHEKSVALARRLADSAEPSARWIGRDALRDLGKPAVLRRLKSDAACARG